MIPVMRCISDLGGVFRGHHIYTVGVEIDACAYLISVTMAISLPTGAKIFNWICTYIRSYGIPFFSFRFPFLYGGAALFTLISLFWFAIG